MRQERPNHCEVYQTTTRHLQTISNLSYFRKSCDDCIKQSWGQKPTHTILPDGSTQKLITTTARIYVSPAAIDTILTISNDMDGLVGILKRRWISAYWIPLFDVCGEIFFFTNYVVPIVRWKIRNVRWKSKNNFYDTVAWIF